MNHHPAGERAALIQAFLAAHGWDGAERRVLAADASFRTYDRLTDGARRCVLMNAPPPQEDVRPFLRVARHLKSLGLSAPAILAEDAEAGLLLIEDFGDDTYTRLLARGADETELYALATDTLIALHRRGDAPAVEVPEYDDALLLREADLLLDWYMPAVLGEGSGAEARAAWHAAWTALFPLARAVPRTLVLRDYHVDNLMRPPDRPGVAACGLLDFQDAVAGPVAYDFVSLVEDARRDIAPALKAAMRDRYLTAFPSLSPEAFDAACAVLGAQRHAKVIGIFTRLCRRDGKPHYLTHIPRVWRLLEASLRHPALAPVAAWLDRHLPAARRGVPTP